LNRAYVAAELSQVIAWFDAGAVPAGAPSPVGVDGGADLAEGDRAAGRAGGELVPQAEAEAHAADDAEQAAHGGADAPDARVGYFLAPDRLEIAHG